MLIPMGAFWAALLVRFFSHDLDDGWLNDRVLRRKATLLSHNLDLYLRIV